MEGEPSPLPKDQSPKNDVPRLPISLTRNPEVDQLPEELLTEYEPVSKDLLGEGAFAVVWLLQHRQSREVFALKCIEKHPLRIRNMIEQMNREVRIQQNLVHPNILRLVRAYDDDLYVYMLLEYCKKGSLRTLMGQLPNRRFEEPIAAFYFEQIVKGVEWMHRNSCVHRDLKLENMLLTEHDVVKICDFGWSAEMQIENILKTTCGTMAYWAPEIWESAAQDESVDMWALGCLLYEMLAGHAPFHERDQNKLKQKVLDLEFGYPPWLTNEACHAVHILLQRSPEHRVKCAELLPHAWFSKYTDQYPVAFVASVPQVSSTSSIPSPTVVQQTDSKPQQVAMPITTSTASAAHPSGAPTTSMLQTGSMGNAPPTSSTQPITASVLQPIHTPTASLSQPVCAPTASMIGRGNSNRLPLHTSQSNSAQVPPSIPAATDFSPPWRGTVQFDANRVAHRPGGRPLLSFTGVRAASAGPTRSSQPVEPEVSSAKVLSLPPKSMNPRRCASPARVSATPLPVSRSSSPMQSANVVRRVDVEPQQSTINANSVPTYTCPAGATVLDRSMQLGSAVMPPKLVEFPSAFGIAGSSKLEQPPAQEPSCDLGCSWRRTVPRRQLPTAPSTLQGSASPVSVVTQAGPPRAPAMPSVTIRDIGSLVQQPMSSNAPLLPSPPVVSLVPHSPAMPKARANLATTPTATARAPTFASIPPVSQSILPHSSSGKLHPLSSSCAAVLPQTTIFSTTTFGKSPRSMIWA